MKFVGRCNYDQKIIQFFDNFSPENEYVIWGCGNAFRIIYNDIGSVLKIKYCVDANTKLQGTTLYGNQIVAPEYLFRNDKKNIKILMTPVGYKMMSICETLIDNGFDEGNFCSAFDWLTLYKYHYQNILSLQEITLVCTTLCTLNCKGCCAYVPYHKRNRHFDLKTIIHDIDSFFSVVDFVSVITLGTGEVLLYPHIIDVLNYIYENYKGRYGDILIITNATHVPKPDIMETLQRVDCHIKISEYESIGSRCKIHKLSNAFERYHIDYHTEKLFGTETEIGGLWSDLGDPSISHNKTEEEKALTFENCAVCSRFLHNGRLFYCTPQCGATMGGLYNPQEDECIDFTKPVQKIDILKYHLGIQPSGYIPFCDRCDGLGIVANPKTIAAGQQLRKKDNDVEAIYG
ncbi:MAG: radical SAM protein [Deltaproteobacteria bacterium]|nr:radical SAM protein [Deltaproteobacteria bacterium]